MNRVRYCLTLCLCVLLICSCSISSLISFADSGYNGTYSVPTYFYTSNGDLLTTELIPSATITFSDHRTLNQVQAGQVMTITIPNSLTISDKLYSINRNNDIKYYYGFGGFEMPLWIGAHPSWDCTVTYTSSSESSVFACTFNSSGSLQSFGYGSGSNSNPYANLMNLCRNMSAGAFLSAESFHVTVYLKESTDQILEQIGVLNGSVEDIKALIQQGQQAESDLVDQGNDKIPSATSVIDSFTLPGADSSALSQGFNSIQDITQYLIVTDDAANLALINDDISDTEFVLWFATPFIFTTLLGVILYIKESLSDG